MQFKGLTASIELSHVLDCAHEIALQSGQPFNSAHLLLALFTVDNRAKTILQDKGLEVDRVIDEVMSVGEEPVDAVSVVHNKAAQFTESCGTNVVGTLHLLAGLCRVSRSQAYMVLEHLGVKPSELRTTVIRYLTGGMPRQYLIPTATPHADRVFPGRQGAGAEPQAQQTVAVAEPEVEPEPYEDDRYDDRFESAPARPSLLDVAVPEPERTPASRYQLDPETYPMLTKLGRNLTWLAEQGRLDPLIGRTREVEQLVDILNKRRSNNPCLVGEPGVGKTAVVEGLAQLIVDHDARVGALGEKVLVELEMGGLVAGTQLRGAFAERLAVLKDEVGQADGRIVLFIDEIHTLIGAGGGDGALDAANDLKASLARGEFPCIGATTEREYRRHIEADPALERRFQVVTVEEPSEEDAIAVLEGLAPSYAEHHQVRYRADALEAAVRLSARWIQERFLPAKAVDALDTAGSHASRHNKRFVTDTDVAKVVAKQVGVPEERLLVSERQRLLDMPGFLHERVVAHDEAMSAIASVIQRNFAGFTSRRPMGSFLLLGPTGVGKTEAARVLADFLFASRDALTRIDMSEYMDAHSVSRLIGAPPGYVGHDDGGQLTEAVRRRPYQILLFDEVEKAASEVLNILLQLLEEGELTDGRGRRVRFRHTVVILTSNLGAEHFDQRTRSVGFGSQAVDPAEATKKALNSARKAFSPELWNRIEEKLVFRPLTREDVERIARLLLTDSARRLEAERQLTFVADETIIPLLIERGGYDEALGARPMRRVVQTVVEGAVAAHLLRNTVAPGTELQVSVKNGEVVVS